jgi:hypothetical protein
MTPHYFALDVELDDGSALAAAAFELGAALAKVPGVELESLETAASVGARRDGVILAIIISFATSLTGTAAYDVLKAAISHSRFQFSLKVETSFPAATDNMAAPHPKLAPDSPKAKPVKVKKRSGARNCRPK